MHLPHQRLVGAEQQLLARLAARVEGARHLRAAKRAVVEQAAVLARERHALRDALVDDVDAHLREAVDVRFARAVVAALDRVVEEAVDAVAVVLVVLRGVDAALRGDAVRAARAVLDAEAQDVVAELAERRGRRRAGQAGADDDDRVLALVGRVDQLHLELVPIPLLGDRARRECFASSVMAVTVPAAKCAQSAMTMKPPAISDGDALCRPASMTRRPRGWSSAERLERARDAVPQVRADDQHAEHVEARPSAGCGSSPSPGGRGRVRRPATAYSAP